MVLVPTPWYQDVSKKMKSVVELWSAEAVLQVWLRVMAEWNVPETFVRPGQHTSGFAVDRQKSTQLLEQISCFIGSNSSMMCQNKPSWWAQCGDIDIFAHLDSAEDSSVIRCKARRITRVSSEWTWALATESTANYWEVYESRLYRIIYIYFHIVMWLGYTFLYYWQVCILFIYDL